MCQGKNVNENVRIYTTGFYAGHDKTCFRLLAHTRKCTAGMLYTLKHLLLDLHAIIKQMHQRLLMAGVVGRVDAIVNATKLLPLPVSLSSET